MLVICYTNHALDQFLEGIYAFNKNIVRIGGKSKSDILLNCNLQAIRKENGKAVSACTRQNRWEVRRKIEDYQTEIGRLEFKINGVITNIMGRELSDVLLRFNANHYNQLVDGYDFEDALLVYLGYKVVKDVPKAEEEMFDMEGAFANVEIADVGEKEDDDKENNNDADTENNLEEVIDEEELLHLEVILREKRAIFSGKL